MAQPITVPIETDPDELAVPALEYLESVIPGWNRYRADAMFQLIMSVARIIADARDTASDVPPAVFRYLGDWLVQLAPIDASQASTTATITATDTEGWTIPAGSRFLVKTSGDTGIVFYTPTDAVIAPGDSSIAGVELLAETAGADGSGLPDTSTVESVDALSFIDTVTLDTITTGGVDGETHDEYLARLVDELALFTNTPILPDDFAVLARRVAGVARSLALDGYDPVAETDDNERMVTVAVADETGMPLSTGVKNATKAYLQALREITFVVHVIDGTYTTIDATSEYTVYPGFDAAAVDADVEASKTAYLSPGTWGAPPTGEETIPAWLNTDTVRYLEMAEVINRVEGVNYITDLLIGRRQMVTGLASTDVLTATAHGFVLDTPVVFRTLTGGAPLVVDTTYFARDITANTFKVAATAGGSAINLTTDITDGTVVTMGTNDIPLEGPAALPLPGTITAAGVAP